MLYSISLDCKYSIHVHVYSRTTCGQKIKYLSIYLSFLCVDFIADVCIKATTDRTRAGNERAGAMVITMCLYSGHSSHCSNFAARAFIALPLSVCGGLYMTCNVLIMASS